MRTLYTIVKSLLTIIQWFTSVNHCFTVKQVDIDDKTIQQIEERRAVESILEDHKYNKAMKLMPEPLKQMNFS